MTRGRGGSEQGSVAVTVALAMTVLLGLAALVVDVGLNWAARTSAQTAADSAALAGASELLAAGPDAAILTVRDYLNDNVAGLADPLTDPWPTDGIASNGEVDCWTLPAPPPDVTEPCLPGSNALQVTTPPIEVDYAFAPILGRSSNAISARAAAGAGPAAPNNCVLCLLEPAGANALAVLGDGGIDVAGGGIVVNSISDEALALSGDGDITADQIRVVGGLAIDPGAGSLSPAPQLGGPPVGDPLANLPTPDQLVPPPAVRATTPQVIATDTPLPEGIYPSITVTGGATLTLEGVYVVTQLPGLQVTGPGSTVISTGGGATIYLACAGYPAPCSGPGARLQLDNGGQFEADPPDNNEYAGLSIFADRGNTQPNLLLSDNGLDLDGALYTAGAPLVVNNLGGLQVDSLLVVDSLTVALAGPVEVSYDPSVPLPGIGGPVLIL